MVHIQIPHGSLAPLPLRTGKSHLHILPYGHVREQRIVLKQITDAPVLNFYIDSFLGIKEYAAV